MATLKQLMTLLSAEGLLEQRAEIICNWTKGRTTSARELTPQELAEICTVLQKPAVSLDKSRKRLIAAIFGFYEKMNRKVSIEYVKQTACIAARVENFNDIPEDRLISLYNAFTKRQKDLDFTARMVENFISEQQSYN